jgi:hypothetical protein
VACDVLSLLIQAVGGIIASIFPLTEQAMVCPTIRVVNSQSIC